MSSLKTLYLGILLLVAMPSVAENAYLINPGDVLQVFVWNEESLNREVLVRPDGLVSLPMAGEVLVANSTPSQVSLQIAKALGHFMKDEPQVTVSMLNVNGNKIYVLGKVARPGEYVVNHKTDVMQALALAGGLNSFAAENDIRILRRQADGNQVSIKFEYAKVKAGKNLDSNIILSSRDVVVVP